MSANLFNSGKKSEWRLHVLQKRRCSPSTSRAISEHLNTWLCKRDIKKVLAYNHISGEPDVSYLKDSTELLTTRTHYKPEPRLSFHPFATATELTPAGYLQPPKNTPTVSICGIDAVLVPALAFDYSGNRLGYGKGFYDRFLSNFSGIRIGVVCSEFLVPQLPKEPHDIAMHWVATEIGVYEVASGSMDY